MNTVTPPEASVSSINEYAPEHIKSRITISEPDHWVNIRSVDEDFAPKQTHPQVILLLDTQHNVSQRRYYQRIVRRLETLQGVQSLSQWNLDFDPVTDQVIIHSVKVQREGKSTDHADLAKLRFLHREQQMDKLVIDGRWTLVLLLEDVRVGDLLDISYTIITTPRFLQDRYSMLSQLPCYVPTRAFYLRMLFPSESKMKWISNDPSFTPTVQSCEGQLECSWAVENAEMLEPEYRIPSWYSASKFVQASDCESWHEVASAIAKIWPDGKDQAEASAFAKALLKKTPNILEAAEKIIHFVQDEIRYLSVNEDFGGQIPAAPDVVLRRRFGDCKDKALLLSTLLRHIGVEGRPVLVNASLKGKVKEFLPSPNVFNHVIVDFTIEGRQQWVDPTIFMQGGGGFHSSPPNFELGLAVDFNTTDLSKIDASAEYNTYKVSETFLLDTAGELTTMTVCCQATGIHADNLRQTLALEGPGMLSKNRDQFYRNIFPNLTRSQELKWRDDRRQNRLVLAECYALGKPFNPVRGQRGCEFIYSSHLMQSLLAHPPTTQKRVAPCTLPEMGTFEHQIKFQSTSMYRDKPKFVQKQGEHFKYFQEIQKSTGEWVWKYALTITSDTIESQSFETHVNAVKEIWPGTTICLTLPMGVEPGTRLTVSPEHILEQLEWNSSPSSHTQLPDHDPAHADSRIRPRTMANRRKNNGTPEMQQRPERRPRPLPQRISKNAVETPTRSHENYMEDSWQSKRRRHRKSPLHYIKVVIIAVLAVLAVILWVLAVQKI